jgi:hypothetical protein
MSYDFFSRSELEVQRKVFDGEISRMQETLVELKQTKTKIESVREQASTIEKELKTVSLTLTEFKAVQTGGKRQEAMRKEIHRLKKLQTQRKAEIESLEVCAYHRFVCVLLYLLFYPPAVSYMVAVTDIPHISRPKSTRLTP